MREGLRQSMAWLHTWSGLLVCWVLFLVFCAGTATYFKAEISLWMKPELHRAAQNPLSSGQQAQIAVNYMREHAAQAPRWFINLPADRSSELSAGWIVPPTAAEKAAGKRGKFQSDIIDTVSGEKMAAVRETRGGEFLYRLHFDLHYMPALWARWIVGVCAMFMLVAIISGVVTHKRIFKDFFTFRSGKGQRSWLDAHNATAVLALPYHLMITYTGLVTLMFMYMPSAAQVAYKGDEKAFFSEVFPGNSSNAKPAGVKASLTAMAPLVAQAEQHWGGTPAARLVVNHPGDANATVVITRQRGAELSYLQPSMQFNGVTGALLAADGDQIAPAAQTRGVLYGLHMAHFAQPLLRVLFFLCGLAGCAMVATGALLWAVKERQSYAKVLAQGGHVGIGLRLVDGLNIGAIAGLPIAFAAYFWANRLLPVVLEKRAEAEITCFFAAWAVSAVLAHIRPDRRMWQWQLWAGALLFIGLPVLNIFTTSSHLGVTLLQGRGPWAVAGFDLTVLALGLFLAAAARKVGRKAKNKSGNAAAPLQRRPVPQKEAA